MPRKLGNIPAYSLHRGSGQAIVRISGRDHYLGPHNSPESREKYDRLIAEWLANGRQPLHEAPPDNGLLINELLLKWDDYIVREYESSPAPSKELANLRIAIRPLKNLYGGTFAKDFGPLALKAVREHLVHSKKLCRKEINKRVSRIKRVFKWAVSEELIPPYVFEALRTVDGLRAGRTPARENPPVTPVDEDVVNATMPFLSPQVAAMICLQRLTGMRSAELTVMRPCDLDRTGELWTYRLTEHKTAYLGNAKTIQLGPKAQELLTPFLNRPDEAYFFFPIESEEWRNAQRSFHQKPDRKTKVFPSELKAREKRKQTSKQKVPKRPKRDHYDTASYRRAVKYAITKAEKAGVKIPDWFPYQIRHSVATEVRRRYGIEGAQVVLGHARADVTQIYAERNSDLAARIAKESG